MASITSMGEWSAILSLIFGGCCSNAWTLERVTLLNPNAGSFITLAQFLFISLYGLLQHVRVQRSVSGRHRIPKNELMTKIVLAVLEGRMGKVMVKGSNEDDSRGKVEFLNGLKDEFEKYGIRTERQNWALHMKNTIAAGASKTYMITIVSETSRTVLPSTVDSSSSLILELSDSSDVTVLIPQSQWNPINIARSVRLKERKIPIRIWLVQVVLFFFISLLNNAAFGYTIPMSVHIIFRSGGLVINMIVGRAVGGRRYTRRQILSVLTVTAGVVCTTLSASQNRHVVSGDKSVEAYATGIAILTAALILSGFLGLAQDRTYAKYGRGKEHGEESMFYLHFLAIPGFIFFGQDIRKSWRETTNQTFYIYLALNVLTQFVCVSGVNQLSGRVSSLTVTLVLAVRKAVSLLFSMKNGEGWMMWIGAGLVFGGTVAYTIPPESKPTSEESEILYPAHGCWAMLTLSKEKNQNNNNIWHSPSSKSNGIYAVEPVTHTEHDAGSLSSSPLSSPDSKNMQSEQQQQLDATETNFNTSSSQSSPLSELSNLNDDDQPQDQQQQSSVGPSDASSSNLNSNPPSGLVLNQNGITDGSRHAESKSDLSAEQLAGSKPAGESTNNATATVNVTSQPHHQQQRHTNTNTSNSSSPSPSQHQHVNGMGVSAALAVRDSSSSTPAPAAALISTTSSTYPLTTQSNEQHSSRSSSDIPDEKVAAILLLNIELFKVCMECQTRQLMQSSEFNAYVSRLQSNLSWLAAVADQNRLKHIPLPILTPPVPLPWHPPHTINDFYQRLSILFARDIAKRQAAAALNANPGPGGGGMPPGSANVAAPRSAGGASANSVSATHPSVPGPGPIPGMGVPIQPAPQNMMTAGIKRGPPTDAMHDDQTGMRKRVDTGERRHSNPPLAAAPTPPHARSPSVMSNGTGVSVSGPGAGGMGMNNSIGMQDMNMHPQTNMALSMGVGGMSGMQAGQAHSPHSSGPVVGHPSHSPTPLRGPRSSPEVAITQQVQAGMHSPQGAQPHGHLPQSQNPAFLQQHAPNTQLGFGSQGIGMSMSDVQAQVQAAQMAQRARMLQQAQAVAAMQSNRANPNPSLHPGIASSAGAMKDPRMAAMMSNTGVGGPAIAPNPATMNTGQSQLHSNLTSAGQMAPAPATTAPMNTAGGMSMQIQPPPSPSATMLQAIVNAFGANGLKNYEALQNGASHPFVNYMLTHVPGFAHLPWQQQLQRMQVVQNNIRQQQRLQTGNNNMPAGQGDQTNSRNGLINPAIQTSAISPHANQGHPQAHMDQTVASPFNRQSGSPPNVGGMAGLPSPQGQQMGSGQAHQHMSPPPSISMPTRPGTAGSQSGGGGGPMNMGGQPGTHHVSGGAGPNQNITPQERQLRLMQQQMHHRGNDGVLNTVQAFTSADKVRQHQQGAGQQQQQAGQGQMGMHPGAMSAQSSSAGSPPNTASGVSAPFGHPQQMGMPMNMNMNLGNNMGIGGMGIGPMGGMPNSNRSAPSPSDMISAAAAVRGAGAGGVLAPNMTQKRPTAMQNDAYHQMALYNQAQRQQQQSHQMANAGIRPGTAMGGMNPAAMAAVAQQQQQQQQQHQHQYANTVTSAGGGTINPGMIYGSNNNNGGGNPSGGVQSSQSQQQAYLSQAQSAAQMSRSQSQPPFHAISPAALQHHPDGTTRIGTPGSVGGGMGGTPRPGSSASNAGSMLPTDGLGGDSLESLFNWNGA